MTTSTDPLARYRHPHLLKAVAGPGGRPAYTIELFTGWEPRPEQPPVSRDDPALTRGDRERLRREYVELAAAWGLAQFKTTLGPHIEEAAARWQAYAEARLVEAEAHARLCAREFRRDRRADLESGGQAPGLEGLGREWPVGHAP